MGDHGVRIRGFLHGRHPRKKIRIHREYSCLSWCLFNVAITGVKAKVETVVKALMKALVKTLEIAILTAIE